MMKAIAAILSLATHGVAFSTVGRSLAAVKGLDARRGRLLLRDMPPGDEATEAPPVATEAEAPVAQPGSGDEFIQKYVKPRDDWWASGNPKAAGPIDTVAAAVPLPSYFWLLTATVGAIAFVGCIFQLFYDQPPAPVLGVPLTTLILVTSGPLFVFLFLVAIAKGQKESEEDDLRYN